MRSISPFHPARRLEAGKQGGIELLDLVTGVNGLVFVVFVVLTISNTRVVGGVGSYWGP